MAKDCYVDHQHFDFEDYFDRHRNGLLSEEERDEFDMRVIGLFCRDWFQGGGNPRKIQQWVGDYLAEQMYKVINGEEWHNAFPLPWKPSESHLSRRGERAMSIYCAIGNEKAARPELTTDALLKRQAREHHVSYETARGDYYAVKKVVDAKGEESFPDWFLKKESEI